MIIANFDLYVTYSQLSVFDPSLEDPFNDWTPQHVAQGFSWRTESVSFATLEEAGDHNIEVQVTDKFDLKSTSKRAILVPFFVKSSGVVEIASIADSKQVEIDQGYYALIFENGYEGQNSWCRFSFVPGETVEPEIILADEELSPSFPLLLEASPAL